VGWQGPSRRQEMKVSSLFQKSCEMLPVESSRVTAPGTRCAVARGSSAAACVRVSLSCLAPWGAQLSIPFSLSACLEGRVEWAFRERAQASGLSEALLQGAWLCPSLMLGAWWVCGHTQHGSLILGGACAGEDEADGDAARVGARCDRLARLAVCR